MKRLLLVALLSALFVAPALAQSTINPNVPAQNAPLSSAPVRGNFAAAVNDVNGLLGMHGVSTLGTCRATPLVGTDCLVGSAVPFTWYKYWNGSYQQIGTLTSGGFLPAGATSGANPTATAGPAAINGVATTFMRSDAAPVIQLGTNSQKGLVQCDTTTITCTGGVITAIGAASTAITVGVTNVGGGSAGRVLYDNGTLGEYAITGTGSVVMSTSPTLSGTMTLPDGGTHDSGGINGSVIGTTTPRTGAFTSLSATAQFTLGPSLSGNPAVINFSALTAGSYPPLIQSTNNYQALQSIGGNNFTNAIQVNSFGSGSGSTIALVQALGTPASPTAVTSGIVMGEIVSTGYNGSGYGVLGSGQLASLQFVATQNFTGSAFGTKVVIQTIPNGTTTAATAATFDQDGSLNVVGNYKNGGVTGISGTKTPTGACSITWTGGIVTATTC